MYKLSVFRIEKPTSPLTEDSAAVVSETTKTGTLQRTGKKRPKNGSIELEGGTAKMKYWLERTRTKI